MYRNVCADIDSCLQCHLEALTENRIVYRPKINCSLFNCNQIVIEINLETWNTRKPLSKYQVHQKIWFIWFFHVECKFKKKKKLFGQFGSLIIGLIIQQPKHTFRCIWICIWCYFKTKSNRTCMYVILCKQAMSMLRTWTPHSLVGRVCTEETGNEQTWVVVYTFCVYSTKVLIYPGVRYF